MSADSTRVEHLYLTWLAVRVLSRFCMSATLANYVEAGWFAYVRSWSVHPAGGVVPVRITEQGVNLNSD